MKGKTFTTNKHCKGLQTSCHIEGTLKNVCKRHSFLIKASDNLRFQNVFSVYHLLCFLCDYFGGKQSSIQSLLPFFSYVKVLGLEGAMVVNFALKVRVQAINFFLK